MASASAGGPDGRLPGIYCSKHIVFFPRIGFPVVDQGGLRNQRAAQRNKIRLLILNDVLHHGRRFQAAHGDDRDRNLFFDFRISEAHLRK
jgi:hypothetical protein